MYNIALYGGFLLFVLAMLLVDLKVFHREAKPVSTKESAIWAAIWIGLAAVFGVVVYFWKGGTVAAEYTAGFLIEKALSVDNIFVFLLIFSYFNVKPDYQHQVLFYGILGAIVFRGLFIAAGVSLINRFEWILYVLGLVLIYSAYKIGKGTESVHPEHNPVLKLFRKTGFPTTSRYQGQKLFIRENGRLVATPLFVVLLVVEATDIAFAVDSIPAIFAITRDPFVVLTSNVFAILGLRALYFLLAGSLEKFHLLKYGLAFILAFVGVKMLLSHYWHPPIALSLGVIVVALAASVFASLKIPPKKQTEEVLKGIAETAGRQGDEVPGV
ncbi:MAG: TerC family protein [Actinomycetota bacterium]|nr:TerC family protein [Actinomycetota bacterium]